MSFEQEAYPGTGWFIGYNRRTTTCFPYVEQFPEIERYQELFSSEHLQQVGTLPTLQAKTEALLVHMYATIGPHAIHSLRVAALGHDIAREVGYSPAALKRIFWKLLLHDVGKLGVDPAILFKTGTFEEEDRKAMMEHPEIGKKMLIKMGFPHSFQDVPYQHHKMVSGRGYPHHLRTRHLTKDARIAAIADRSDATGDPYRGYGLPVVFEGCIRRMIELFEEGELDNKIRPAYNNLMQRGFYRSLQEFNQPEDWADTLQVYALELMQQYELVNDNVLRLLGENVEWQPDEAAFK